MKYRSEIDGLRAVAVIPVLLFHAGFGAFAGGFVGVDVFFVISGYLITTIIVDQMQTGRFSLWTFYERRARRILPALFLVVLCCMPVAYVLLLPGDMKDFAQSAFYVSIFASNIFFWRESGYFATAAELQPLLHTWSLAVEEQFYILFPLFLLAAWRFGRRAIIWTLVLCLVVSLAAAQWGAYNKPTAAFFLLPTRAWELLIGALAAFYLRHNRISTPTWLNNTLSAFGLAAILAAVFLFDKETPFPSLYALLPTLGTLLIILFALPGTVVQKVLSLRLLVGIGLISYSLYLWHQPIFAFYRHITMREFSEPVALGLIALALLLSVLSYFLVEQPLRHRSASNRRVLSLAGLSCMVIGGLGIFGWASDGVKYRVAGYKSVAGLSDMHPCRATENDASRVENAPIVCLGEGAPGADLYLLGDSHAHQLVYPLRNISAENGQTLYFINPGTRRRFASSLLFDFKSDDDYVYNHLLDVLGQDDIVIIGIHRGYFNDVRDAHLDPKDPVEVNKREVKFIENFSVANEAFRRLGVKVVLVLDAPLLHEFARIEKCLNEEFATYSACHIEQARDLHTRTRQDRVYRQMERDFDNVFLYDAAAPLFQDGVFDPITSDRDYLMFDNHHLSERGTLLLKDSLGNFLSEVSGKE